MEITLRKETPSDWKQVEQVTREAFWNHYVPGCSEHYLAHIMRDHRDFIQDLDYVAMVDDQIVGNIMYTKSRIIDEREESTETITFGPISVLPEYQRKGIGSSLIQHTIRRAIEKNHKAIIIYGSPSNYCKHGFKSSKDYNVSTMSGKYPYGLLVLELERGIFNNHTWKFQESDVFNLDLGQADEFDKLFTYKDKGYRYSQEEFKIACRAYIE